MCVLPVRRRGMCSLYRFTCVLVVLCAKLYRAVLCATRCVLPVWRRKGVFWLYCVPECVFCLMSRGMCWLLCVSERVFYLCEGEVCVLCTVCQKVCCTRVNERCVLTILCTRRCFTLWRRGICWLYCVPQDVLNPWEGKVYWLHSVPEGVHYLCDKRGACWLYCVPRNVCFTCVKARCVLAIPCTTKVCFTCVKERCVLAILSSIRCGLPMWRRGVCWLYCVPQSVFYLCEGEVCVGHTMYHKVCFTSVKERCVLAVLCTTRCVLPVWRRGVCWLYCVTSAQEGVFHDASLGQYHVTPDRNGFHWIHKQDTIMDFRGDYIDNTGTPDCLTDWQNGWFTCSLGVR